MKDLTTILEYYLSGEDTKSLFIQMFVEYNSYINFRYFNSFHKTSLTFKEILKGIKAVLGEEGVKYKPEETDTNFTLLGMLKKEYKFGKYENARDYIHEMYLNTGHVIDRVTMLNWIAEQKPKKAVHSFAPMGVIKYEDANGASQRAK